MRENLIEREEELARIVRDARTIAVVGMKDGSDADAPAFTIPKALKARGLRVIPVNPMIQSSLGLTAYKDLASVPEAFDLVDVFRRSDSVAALADEILALPPPRRPRVVWLQTGIRNDVAAAKLAEAGIQVVQDHCLGVYSARYRELRVPTLPV
ncbi:MAG TPA: CoA-binding protein [Polyangia bacterium]|nr:CoA-binding protein [Polyangia bacterium]